MRSVPASSMLPNITSDSDLLLHTLLHSFLEASLFGFTRLPNRQNINIVKVKKKFGSNLYVQVIIVYVCSGIKKVGNRWTMNRDTDSFMKS